MYHVPDMARCMDVPMTWLWVRVPDMARCMDVPMTWLRVRVPDLTVWLVKHDKCTVTAC